MLYWDITFCNCVVSQSVKDQVLHHMIEMTFGYKLRNSTLKNENLVQMVQYHSPMVLVNEQPFSSMEEDHVSINRQTLRY